MSFVSHTPVGEFLRMNGTESTHSRIPFSYHERFRWLALETGLIVGIAIFVVYSLTKFQFATLLVDQDRQGDFQMWYLLPPQIRALSYPTVVTGDLKIVFPYFPSAVAMMLPLSWLPQPVSFALWLSLQCISLVIILWVSLDIAGIARARTRLPVAAAAVFIVSSPLQWDLRGHNNNLIYLALIMLGLAARSTWVSAILFAATANLKIYSGVMVAGFLWVREYRLAASMALAGLLIAIGLPILVFGYDHFVELIPAWLDQVRFTMSPDIIPPLSIRKTITALIAGEPNASVVTVVAISTQIAWIGFVVAYFAVAAKPGVAGGDIKAARLCDVTVMLLLPLPLSSWFVPYHALVMLPAFVLIVANLIDETAPRRVRVLAAATAAGCVLIHMTIRSWELRAGVYLVDFVMVVLTLGAIRLSLAQRPVSI